MNRNRSWLFLLSMILAVSAGVGLLAAAGNVAQGGKSNLAKPAITDAQTLDINQIECFIQNDGHFAENPATGGDGFFYPKGQRNTSIIFTSGLWVLGKIDGDIRTAACDYATEFQPGAILPGTVADDPTLPKYKIYKYNKGETVDAEAIAQGCPAEVMGDQMLFCVFNDMGSHVDVFMKAPIGLEVQMTAFAFNQTGALGNTVFLRYRFINKSSKTLEDTYAAVFFDPDLGDGNDDYVGCDTTLGIGYVFNGDGYDNKYGVKVPAMACDFFQGPIVPAPGETAVLPDGTILPDMKILDMTAFFAYINGSPITGMEDPDLGMYGGTNGATHAYFFASGFRNTGEAWIDPSQGNAETKFPFAGDPVSGTGWLMADISPPKDMRMGLSAGPFTLPPNDPKDIVVGLVVGQGADNMSSISVMKYYDAIAQNAYNKSFILPPPPPLPVVLAAQTDEELMLTWDTKSVEYSNSGYVFEGYNVWQGSTLAGPWKRVDTIDKINGITTIWDFGFNESAGTLLEMPVQFGSDKGLSYEYQITKDYLTNAPLVNGKEYYFAVTAYAYNPQEAPKILENSQVGVLVIPQKPVLDEELKSAILDTVDVQTIGSTDGFVIAEIMDPTKLTGHTYEITFYNLDTGELVWKLTDATDGRVLLDEQAHQTSSAKDEDWPITDGLKFKVYGAPNDFKNFQVVANAAGPLDPPEIGCFAFNNNGFPFLIDYDGNPMVDSEGYLIDRPDPSRQQVLASAWGIHTFMSTATMGGGYANFLNRVSQDGARWPLIIPNDFEIRFTASGGKGYEPAAFVTGADAGGVLMDVPFELWNVGNLADPNDDVRYFPYLIDWDANGQFNLVAEDHSLSGGDNDPYTDVFYWVIPEDDSPGQAGYEALVNKIQTEGDQYVYLDGTQGDCMRRMVLVNWNGGSVAGGTYNSTMPETGTIFRILTTKPNNPNVKYVIDTAPYKKAKNEEVAKKRIETINVFPNPYFGQNEAESDFFTQFVTFNNLPEKCTIRVFSLSGQLVKTIQHDDGTPFEKWYLLNEQQLPVASGMYLVHVETAFGNRILKLAVINREARYQHI
ncbi:T9SS type A sorting domain-containing protein [bacterium]|nr:T9SS type A sorting domain-containing protein [bacterium]